MFSEVNVSNIGTETIFGVIIIINTFVLLLSMFSPRVQCPDCQFLMISLIAFFATERGVLIVTLLQGKDMAAMDSNGKQCACLKATSTKWIALADPIMFAILDYSSPF